jgi:hypothetical protein
MSEQAFSIRTGYDEGHRYVGIIPPFEELTALQGVEVEGDKNTTLTSVDTVQPDNGPEYTRLVFDTTNDYDGETARLLGKATMARLQEYGHYAQMEGRTADLRSKEPHLFIPRNNLPLEELPLKPNIEGIDELPEPPFLFADNRSIMRLITGGPGGESVWQTVLGKLVDGVIIQEDYDGVMDYIRWAEDHLLIDGQTQAATIQNIVTFNAERSFFSDAHFDEDNHQRMIERFEYDYLGLERKHPQGGTRWWASNAGFASGTYPTEVVSRMLGVDAATFVELVVRESGEYGHVVIKSDDFLVAVSSYSLSEENTVITRIMELSEAGKGAYKLLMRAYEKGAEDSVAEHEVAHLATE